jgi:phosphoglycolate phosphatase
MHSIENPHRLAIDTPFLGASNFLKKTSKNRTLFLVTARQNPSLVEKQCKDLGWLDYFNKILVTEQKKTKSALIREYVKCTTDDYFIGDTGEDILAGKDLGLKTIAVCSGVLCKNILMEYHPDHIFETLEETLSVL